MNIVSVIVHDEVSVTILEPESSITDSGDVCIIVDDVINVTSDKSYIHVQAVAADTVVIVHDLDKYPSVTVIDSAGDMVIPQLEYITGDSLRLTFGGALAFTAYLN